MTRLGVDLGTTWTAAALQRNGRSEAVALGSDTAAMFGMMGQFLPAAAATILASNPVLLGAGALFGGLQMSEDRKRKVAARRQSARQQVRQFLDDVQFEVTNEAASLREVAATAPDDLDLMLLSAEQFCDLHTSGLTVEVRRALLDRLGMYGVRAAVEEIRAGATTAASLGPKLVERSGLNQLNEVIAEHFLPRARVLQARSALVAIRSLAHRLRAADPSRGDYVDREAERIEAGAVDFARIRAAQVLTGGAPRVSDAERTELERILLAPTAADALGLPGGTPGPELATASLQLIARWRDRASDPLADPALVEVCEAAARTGEAIYGTTHMKERL